MKTNDSEQDNFVGQVVVTSKNAGWQATFENASVGEAFEYAMGDLSLAIMFRENYPWIAGDIINFLYKFGEDDTVNSVIEKLVGVQDGAHRYTNYAWVARAFPIEERVFDLRWSYYRSAAAIADKNEQARLLAIAEDSIMSTKDFAQLCREAKALAGQVEPQLQIGEIVDEDTEETYDYDDQEDGILEDFDEAKPFNTVTINVTVTEGIHQKMQAIADRKKLTLGDIVMVALSQYVESEDNQAGG